MVGYKLPSLCLPGADRVSQETAISGFHQQALLATTITSRFGGCIWDGSPYGAVSGGPFLQSLSHILLPPVSILFTLLKSSEASTFWSLFLGFIWSVNCIVGIPNFWANIHIPCLFLCDYVTALRVIFSSSIHLPANFMKLLLIAK